MSRTLNLLCIVLELICFCFLYNVSNTINYCFMWRVGGIHGCPSLDDALDHWQGSPQHICVRLSAPCRPTELHLQFQGGFAGAECWLEAGGAPDQLQKLNAFYPENVNRLQTFAVSCPEPVTHVRVVFGSSTDFFGRVVVYKFDLLADSEAAAATPGGEA